MPLDVYDIPRPAFYHAMPDPEWLAGCQQMLADLGRLAAVDGCIAAAWALEIIEEQADEIRSLTADGESVRGDG